MNANKAIKIVQTPYTISHWASIPNTPTYVDEKRPSPTGSTQSALQVGRERALHGSRHHSADWLGNIVEAHAERHFLGEVPLAAQSVVLIEQGMLCLT